METEPLLNRDNNFLRIARLQSRHSNAPHFKMGAVIARGRKILGVGFNDIVKTHPKSNTPFGRIHAEFSAVLNARNEDLNGATLYVFRAGQKESPLLAKPCKHCQSMIRHIGIKRVVFSTTGSYTKVNTNNL